MAKHEAEVAVVADVCKALAPIGENSASLRRVLKFALDLYGFDAESLETVPEAEDRVARREKREEDREELIRNAATALMTHIINLSKQFEPVAGVELTPPPGPASEVGRGSTF